MDLLNEEQNEKDNKGRKIVIGAIIFTIILIIIVAVLILILQQAENNKLKLNVDGKSRTMLSGLMITDENTGTRFFSISKVASLVGYEFYNGEYKQYSEDKTKCYVECKDELAMFELNSNTIYKNNTEDKLNFDAYKMDNTVISYNNELYAALQSIQTAFNTKITYRQGNNTIYFQTLPYLIKTYESQATINGYTDISKDFTTQKTLIKNMLVVNKDGKYGVVSTVDFSRIIGIKYDSIKYLENTEEFIVTSDQKTGTLSLDGETKIGLRYDDVNLIDGQAGLYYVKNDNLYGVLNKNGKVLVYIEYDDIGIDRKVFPLYNFKNNLFLYENCIPLKKGNKWGLADKNGNIIVSFEYDQLGYAELEEIAIDTGKNTVGNAIVVPTVKEKSINNVVVIPEIEGIVVGKNNKYGVVSSVGKVIIPCEYDKIYSITNEGKDEYYLERNNKTTKLNELLNQNATNTNQPTNTIMTNTTNNTTTNVVVNTNTNTTTNVTNNTNVTDTNEAIIIL